MNLSIALTSNRYEQIAESNLKKLESIFSSQLPQGSFLVEIELISEEKMRTINQKHRSINHSTDVLSFPLLDLTSNNLICPNVEYLLGNIFISPTTAKKYKETVLDLIHHGMLHILGYDHETDMHLWLNKEEELLALYKKDDLQIQGIVHE